VAKKKRIKFLREPEHPLTSRCEVMRDTKYANDRVTTDKQCARNATIIYDGVHMCRQHAGRKALLEIANGS